MNPHNSASRRRESVGGVFSLPVAPVPLDACVTGAFSSSNGGSMHRLLCMLAAVLCLGLNACGNPFAVAAAKPDGSKWTIDPNSGQPVKVGTFDHDSNGNVINRKGDTEGAKGAVPPKQAAQEGLRGAARSIGTVAFILMLLSVVGVVASFFVPWLPRATATKSFCVSLGLFIVQYWFNRYGEGLAVWSFWLMVMLLIGSAVAFGWPWIVTYYNRNKEQAGLKLAAAGDHRAGTALVIDARPDDFKTAEDRKALLARMGGQA